jgi:creatinine amidohydrolase
MKMGKELSKLTWVDAQEAFKTTKLALVPTGSIEQHGPHMPLGTDAKIAEYLALEVTKELDCVVTPLIPIGNAEYHTDFPGTLAVEPKILKEYYKSICLNLVKYGITHILFVNGHGGNLGPILDVAYDLRREKGVVVAAVQWWDVVGHIDTKWSMIGHGDIVETSMMLALDKDSVKMERASIPKSNWITEKVFPQDRKAMKFEGCNFYMHLRTSDVTPTGDFIEYGHSATADYTVSPADSTVENGEAILKAMTEYTVKLAKELVKIQLKPLEQ